MKYNTKIIGILNLTPDSFSDGGLYFNKSKALDHAQKLIKDGADIIDIGAESTRPGAEQISSSQEWNRIKNILPPVLNFAHNKGVKISMDTRHPETASKVIDFGVDYINDVSGFENLNMVKAVSSSKVKLIAMHNLGIPAQRDLTLDKNIDVIDSLNSWFYKKIRTFNENNITLDRVIFDPGIGFGKTAQQSWDILKRINKIKTNGCKLYIGHSRKSFLNSITEKDFSQRDIETLAVSIHLFKEKIDYLRVHDVQIHKSALNVLQMLNS